ncbi:hypothetical protein RUND412_002269 [Rhizina undulata]
MANVQIPNVTATQLISITRIPLTTSRLTLSEPLPHSRDPTAPKLLLTIANLTIPLYSSSIVGTKDEQTYLITLSLPSDPGSTSTSTAVEKTEMGFIELKFPATVLDENSSASNAADEFEALLVKHGFLQVGLPADAEDLSRTLQEASAVAAAKISERTENRLQGRPSVEGGKEVRFVEGVHGVKDGALDVTRAAKRVSGKVSSAMSATAFDAGVWLGEKTVSGHDGVEEREGEATEKASGKEKSLPREAVEQGVEAVGIAAEGVGKSAATVSSTLVSSASKIAAHEKGPEAQDLIDTTREFASNIGSIAADAAIGTSVVWHAGEAGAGAAQAGKNPQAD